MNKALVLIEALENIITEIIGGEWDGDEETLLQNIHTKAEDTVNMVGGHEEIGYMFEPLRLKTIDLDVAMDHFKDYTPYGSLDVTSQDVKKLLDTIIPVLVAVDDLTDGGVSNA